MLSFRLEPRRRKREENGVKKRDLGISQHPCEQIAAAISGEVDKDRLSQLCRKAGEGLHTRTRRKDKLWWGWGLSWDRGVTCLEKMRLSRLLAVSGHVNTCHVHWLFLMSINCMMTQ